MYHISLKLCSSYNAINVPFLMLSTSDLPKPSTLGGTNRVISGGKQNRARGGE